MLLALLGIKFARLPRRVMSSVRRTKLRRRPRPKRANVKNKNRPIRSKERLKEPNTKLNRKRLTS